MTKYRANLCMARARDEKHEESFGSIHDVIAEGKEWFVHSFTPVKPRPDAPKIHVVGQDCTKPYDIALLNVSATSFGSLSANAIHALNAGAAMDRCAHETGEGGISPHHLAGGELVCEIGTAYFGARTHNGNFDVQECSEKAWMDPVKMVSLKLSQGAKPGIGGVLPKVKITQEVSEIRGVPRGGSVLAYRPTKYSQPRLN